MTTSTDANFDAWVDQNIDRWLAERLPRPSAREILERHEGDLDEWIYPGLVCDSYTMIVGAPKQGKSLIAVNIATAYSQGKPFLGVAPTTGNDPKKVLIITTEANGEKENVSRLHSNGADLDNVFVNKIGNAGIPEDSYAAAELGNIDLVIIDNVIGLCRGIDINKPEAVATITKATERFNAAEVPVIFIHHTAKGTGSNPVYSSMGNAGIPGLMRHLIGVTRRAGQVTLTTNGNLESSAFTVDFDEHGKARLIGASSDDKKQSRQSKTLDTNKEIARLVVESGSPTTKGAAEYAAKALGTNAESIRTNKLPGMVRSGLLQKEKNKPYAFGEKYKA